MLFIAHHTGAGHLDIVRHQRLQTQMGLLEQALITLQHQKLFRIQRT